MIPLHSIGHSMEHHFLLTYSVHPQDPDDNIDVDKANKVRNDIAKINVWRKLDDVETVFTGEMNLTGDNVTMRARAISKVRDKFEDILREHGAKSAYVKINCVLMVDGLGTPIIFEVTIRSYI